MLCTHAELRCDLFALLMWWDSAVVLLEYLLEELELLGDFPLTCFYDPESLSQLLARLLLCFSSILD